MTEAERLELQSLDVKIAIARKAEAELEADIRRLRAELARLAAKAGAP